MKEMKVKGNVIAKPDMKRHNCALMVHFKLRSMKETYLLQIVCLFVAFSIGYFRGKKPMTPIKTWSRMAWR